MGTGPGEPSDDNVAPVPDGARVTTEERVAAATEELYGADPEGFIGRRGELAAAAREAGDRAAAKAIGALRRPTRAAWVVNRLARAEPGAPEKLAELAAALRAAQEAKHGPRLRELSAARGSLVDALTAQALAAAGVADPPPALRLEVAETLTSAIADPEVAADFAAGTLTRAAQWSGFGLPLADTGSDEEKPVGTAARASSTAQAPPADRGGATGRSRARAAKTETGGSSAAADAARRQADLDARLAQEAAERAARRREEYVEAARLAASAATAAAEAVAAEDELESAVRDLEQRLTRARADLAAARARARHAEAAERRARQALDRLPRE